MTKIFFNHQIPLRLNFISTKYIKQWRKQNEGLVTQPSEREREREMEKQRGSADVMEERNVEG